MMENHPGMLMINDDQHLQEESSSRYFLVALEDLLKRSAPTSTLIRKNKYRSKSVDDFLLYRQERHQYPTTNTEIELDLTRIECDDENNEDDSPLQRSRSAPTSPMKIYEKELAGFIDCNETYQQFATDNFIYSMDLSDSNETSHTSNSKFAIFFEDDLLAEPINYEPSASRISSSLINNCLTIAEENEEELEQLKREDQVENNYQHLERLSPIDESPTPQVELEEKLIVYDLATSAPSSMVDRTRLTPSFQPCPNLTNTLTASRLCGKITTNTHDTSSALPVIHSQQKHVRTMKVIQSSSSSLSDFISSTNPEERKTRAGILTNGLLLSHCATNPIPRRTYDKQRQPDLSSSSSSENFSPTDEKLLSRSEFVLQPSHTVSPERKATSLKSISMALPQIVYPIDFEINRSSKVPTSDSGIVIEVDENPPINPYETNYQKTLNDLHIIKQHIVDIESRLNEAMRELEIEQALIEGEHELVFKQILAASESDQDKIEQLYNNLQVLVERIMSEKNSLRNEIDFTEKTIRRLEMELHEAKEEKVRLRKQEIISATRKRYEDLEFQLMELETRCESELEQAEEHFQTEQELVTQNAKLRQNTLRELDHEQNLVFNQATIEKEKLQRDKFQFKILFKQKQIEVNELEQKMLDQMRNHDEQRVKLREKNRLEERPLTRYLPIRSPDLNLRAHIEGGGHLLNNPHVTLTSTSCRGSLHKMGGMKFKTWNRRWFVFDRQCRSLFYYQDKTETKLRGRIAFESILEVYVDHLQSMSLRAPEPREATFIVKTGGRSYYLVAPTVETMRIWVDVIITGAEGNTFAAN